MTSKHRSIAEDIIEPIAAADLELMQSEMSVPEIAALGYARAQVHATLELATQTATLAEQQRTTTLLLAMQGAGWTDLMQPLGDHWEPVRLQVLEALGLPREVKGS